MPKFKYKVRIEPLTPEAQKNWGSEYRFAVSFHKEYGDSLGWSRCYKTGEEVIRAFQRIKEEWEGYDCILGRQSDRVTMANLDFQSSTKGISKGDLFGQPRLL